MRLSWQDINFLRMENYISHITSTIYVSRVQVLSVSYLNAVCSDNVPVIEKMSIKLGVKIK